MKHYKLITIVVGIMMIGLLIAGAAAAESTIPSPRGYVSMAYDAESQQVVLFGGQTGPWHLRTSINGETWALRCEMPMYGLRCFQNCNPMIKLQPS
jgi:hypothetical protein